MKKALLVAIVFILVPSLSFAGNYVRGHYRDTNNDGYKETYVQPHQRTSPNNTRLDNYSYPGNYNPNSGTITPRSDSSRSNSSSNPYKSNSYKLW